MIRNRPNQVKRLQARALRHKKRRIARKAHAKNGFINDFLFAKKARKLEIKAAKAKEAAEAKKKA